MAFHLSERSLQRLAGVHPDLVAVVRLAIQRTGTDFMVVEGLRTAERQRELVAQGASQTMSGLHLMQASGFGHAVDLAPLVGKVIPWNDWSQFQQLAGVVLACARAKKDGGGWSVEEF